MSLILAIETSHPRGSVAVVRDGEVLFEQTFTSERSHNAQVFAPLAEALRISSDGLRAIVVGLGPGSYTGARIGIAAAQGIAVSRKVPVIGLSSVLAPETENLLREFVVSGDARRGKSLIARCRWHVGGQLIPPRRGRGMSFCNNARKCCRMAWLSFECKATVRSRRHHTDHTVGFATRSAGVGDDR